MQGVFHGGDGRIEERIARLESALVDCERKLRAFEAKISSLEEVVDAAIITAVHELIDFLRHNDIEALDEAEFAKRIKELILT